MDRLKGPSPALASVAAHPPAIALELVREAVSDQFGLGGDYKPLVSERDQNFHLQTASGEQFVVKVTSAEEPRAVTDFHLACLLHLEAVGTGFTPRVVRTSAGASAGRIESDRQTHVLRVVSYLDGSPLARLPIDAGIARELGTRLARLDIALRGFRHPGERPVLLWDLQRAAELRSLSQHIDNETTARSVSLAIDDFESGVTPRLASLRRQVIHGDANPENVLLDGAHRVSGIIDFSDSVNAPLIFDPAIAASYLRSAEPLALIAPFIAAYHTVVPLIMDEIELLFDLVRTRLATTISILYWRLDERDSGDAYREKTLQSEGEAIHFLQALEALGRDEFVAGIRTVIGTN